MEYSTKVLEKYFLQEDSSFHQYTVKVGEKEGGIVCVRYPWLRGPYLEFLGILPEFQGQGIGSEIMKWFEDCSLDYANNLWILVSDFNQSAIKFYERQGFQIIVQLDDLVKPGFSEILMRKKIKNS